MNDSKSYRVFKLRSGDTIIARIVGQKEGKLILETPMNMQKLAWFDQQVIPRKELLALNNWIEFTTANTINLPKDFIVGILSPAPALIQIYEVQKEREDVIDTTGGLHLQEDKVNENGYKIMPFEEERQPPAFIADIIQSILENMGIEVEDDEDEEEGIHDLLDEDPDEWPECHKWQDWSDDPRDYFKD